MPNMTLHPVKVVSFRRTFHFPEARVPLASFWFASDFMYQHPVDYAVAILKRSIERL